MIVLKSRHGLHFAVGGWPPFVPGAPVSPPCPASLHHTHCLLRRWKSGVTFPPPVRKTGARLVATVSSRSSNSRPWHYGSEMQVYTELKWNQDNVCINKSGYQGMWLVVMILHANLLFKLFETQTQESHAFNSPSCMGWQCINCIFVIFF